MNNFLENYRKKIIEFKNFDVDEANTKSNLIEPFFKFLGWDIHNFKEVEKEREVISGNFVDYVLKIDENSKIYVEAKKINDDLTNIRIISQAIGYANDDGIEWCLFTNGDKWNIYKTRDPGGLIDKLAMEIIISNNYHIEFLEYFKKENIEKGILETDLNQILLTNKVINALENISTKLPDDFINYIKSKIIGLNESQIREALKNIDMQFENAILPEEVTFSEEFSKEIIASTRSQETIEIMLPKPRTSEIPTWKKYNLIPFPAKTRNFFPGYKIPFILKTDIGELTTWVTGGYKEKIEGDPNVGRYISNNITRFYRGHPELAIGDTLKITKLRNLYYELDYELEIIKKKKTFQKRQSAQ